MQMIQLVDSNDFVIGVALDNTAYRLHLSWNDTAAHWSMDLRDENDRDMVKRIAIVPNFPLLLQYHRHSGVPRGELMAVVVNASDPECRSIDRKGFVSGKFTMVYIPEDEKYGIIQAGI